MTTTSDRAAEIERQIAELKARWPQHSVPPLMWEELEDLESELAEAKRVAAEEIDGGQAGPDRLQ